MFVPALPMKNVAQSAMIALTHISAFPGHSNPNGRSGMAIEWIQCSNIAAPKTTPKRTGGGAITPGVSESDDMPANCSLVPCKISAMKIPGRRSFRQGRFYEV
jgi:hypothetical protein